MTTDKISEEEQDNYLWQWTENSGIFHTYDRTVQDHIEKCFQQGTFTIDLQNAFPHMPYIINLATMTQMRKSTSRIRPIRRFLLPGENLEGVAFVEDPEKGDEENRIESESTLAEPRLRRSRRKRSCSVKTSEPIGGGMSHQELMSSSAGQDVQFGFISHLTRGLSTIKDTVASVWTGRQKRPKSSQRGNDMSLPIFMPRPPYFPVEERTPVENVKLPSEISIIQTNPRRADEILALYSAVAPSTPEDENCCICFEQFDRPSSGAQENPTVSLRKCNHFFHKDCLRAMYDSGFQAGFLQCPVCKTLYGTKIGNQPPGEMTYYSLPCSIPSYPDCDTIRIIYHISPGIQTKEHPHPGKNYTCRGFPRHCYLPDNEKGRLILRLLVLAWERRLIFTVGTSTTTGESDTITWNEIHHKTEFGSNVTGHGYPDPLYFDHVLQELALQGVVVSEDEKIS